MKSMLLALVLSLLIASSYALHQAQHQNINNEFIHDWPTTTNTSSNSNLASGAAKRIKSWGVSQSQTNYRNISNLNAPNWIRGDQTDDQYTKSVFNFITKNNATKCPLATPFCQRSTNYCIQCSGDKPVFDLTLGECVACPAGFQHDPTTHTCVATKCKGNYIWDQALQKCRCPDDYPIDLGCQCVTCLEPFVWNSFQNACKPRCDETHVWNSVTQVCECPNRRPYEVNGECISCNLPFQWNSGSNTCDLKVSSCNSPPQPSQPSQPIQPATTTPTCGSNYVYDSNINHCVCPSNLPFNDGTRCLECNLPQYWDHSLKQCLYCPDFQYFSAVTRNCQRCPADKPSFSNHVCQACPSGTSFDSTSNSCQSDDAGFIDPTATPKVPVYTTRPAQSGR